MILSEAFCGAIRAKPRLSRLDRRILKIVEGPVCPMRSWFLGKLEAHARVQLGYGATEAIDWGSIDWDKILDIFMKIASLILMLAPLFAAEMERPAKSTEIVTRKTRTTSKRVKDW